MEFLINLLMDLFKELLNAEATQMPNVSKGKNAFDQRVKTVQASIL